MIGTIWSVQVVCHRAVAMTCRGMIRTLAAMLNVPRLRYASKVDLTWLLKVTWCGCVLWSHSRGSQRARVLEQSPLGYFVVSNGV